MGSICQVHHWMTSEADAILVQVNTCWGAELQEWKSTRVVHAGPRVRPPYKGTVEAEDCHTGPAHAHIYVGVCSHMCACGWEGKGRGLMGLQCQLGSLNIVQRWALQLHGTRGSHGCRSNSNSQRISLSLWWQMRRERMMIKLTCLMESRLSLNEGRLGTTVEFAQ